MRKCAKLEVGPLTAQIYVRHHRDEPLAILKPTLRDDVRAEIEIQPRALVAGQHAFLVDGAPTRLHIFSIIHARQLLITLRSNKCVSMRASSLTLSSGAIAGW